MIAPLDTAAERAIIESLGLLREVLPVVDAQLVVAERWVLEYPRVERYRSDAAALLKLRERVARAVGAPPRPKLEPPASERQRPLLFDAPVDDDTDEEGET